MKNSLKGLMVAAALLLLSGPAFASIANSDVNSDVATELQNEEAFTSEMATDATETMAEEQMTLMIDKKKIVVDEQEKESLVPGPGHGGGWGRGGGHGGGWGRGHGGWGGRRGWGGYRWPYGRHGGWGRHGRWFPGWGRYPGYACYASDFEGYTFAGTNVGSALYNCQMNSEAQGCRFIGCD